MVESVVVSASTLQDITPLTCRLRDEQCAGVRVSDPFCGNVIYQAVY